MRQDEYCSEIAASLCDYGQVLSTNEAWIAIAIATYLRENKLEIVPAPPSPSHKESRDE